MFREGELVLGPVSQDQIVEKIYTHELNGKSEVQLMGTGTFKALGEVDVFRVHLAKADAKKRVDAHAADHDRKVASRTRKVLAISGVSLLAIAGGVVLAGRYLAVYTPGVSVEKLAWGEIEMDAPTIVKARKGDDELVDYQDSNKPGSTKRPGTARAGNPGGTRGQQQQQQADPDGMMTAQIDKSSIDDVVAKYKKTLSPCLQQAAKPGQVTKVPIEFVIGQAGKVNKVWVDNPDLKDGPLGECLLKELQKWPFKPIEGESPTVGLTFTIKGKG